MSKRPAFVWHADYELDIGRHVFPTSKFRRVRESLIADGLVADGEIQTPDHATDAELLSVLAPEYLADLRAYRHTARTMRSELPITREIVEGCVRAAGGTVLAARRALEVGAACHLGGGFHHGFAGHAEGFCYINDVAIAAATLRAEGLVKRVAVIDTDVHQGNGTAAIFKGVDEVFTFSIHQQDLYPVKQQSDLDIGLPHPIGDAGYMAALSPAIDRIVREFRPELAIIVAGVDPYEGDQLGELGLTMAGMEQRERATIAPLVRAGIRFVTVTGGGYARRLDDTVALHAQTVRVAIEELARA